MLSIEFDFHTYHYSMSIACSLVQCTYVHVYVLVILRLCWVHGGYTNLRIRKQYIEGEAQSYHFLTLKYIPMYPVRQGMTNMYPVKMFKKALVL